MIIQTDQEGRIMIEQLCDVALKQAGIKNLEPVNEVLASIKPIPKEPIPKEPIPKESKPKEPKPKPESKPESKPNQTKIERI